MCYGSNCHAKGPWALLWERLEGGEEVPFEFRVRVDTKPSATRPEFPKEPDEYETYATDCHRYLKQWPQFQWYVNDVRKVENMIVPAMLGWDHGWCIIPVRNQKGSVKGIVARAHSDVQHKSGMRFDQPHGQDPMMYAPDWNLFEKESRVAIVFGMFDAIAVASLGYPVLSPITGQESFNPDWISDWDKLFVIIPDEGEWKAANELAVGLNWRAYVQYLDYPEGVKDPAGYLEEDEKAELKEVLARVLDVRRTGKSLLSLQG
jgi:hypothetical protein